MIIGGRGHDTLRGGNGSDALVGVDLSQGFGVGERDVLFGGEGADFFSLGDEMVLYYDDGDLLTDGRNDYALIRDFETGVDRIIIFGSFSDYTLNEVSGDTEIFTNGDLIAIVRGVTGLSSENFA